MGELSVNTRAINFLENIDPRVGNKFFENFIFTMDWKNKKIVLIPATDSIIPDQLDSFGFSYSYREDKKSLYISEIYENSPAYHSILQIGDIIVGFNKKNMRHLEFSEYCDLIFHKTNELFENQNNIVLEIERENKILHIELYKKEWL